MPRTSLGKFICSNGNNNMPLKEKKRLQRNVYGLIPFLRAYIHEKAVEI